MTALDISQLAFNLATLGFMVFVVQEIAEIGRRINSIFCRLEFLERGARRIETNALELRNQVDVWTEVASTAKDKLGKVEYLLDRVNITPK